MDLGEWLENRDQPLHRVGPFKHLELRVMMLVGDNPALAEATRQRCLAVAEGMRRGRLPFDRPGCYLHGPTPPVSLASLMGPPRCQQHGTTSGTPRDRPAR